MQWIKIHAGTATDPKFRLVARDAGVSTAEALGVWLMLLDKAGDANDDAGGFNPRLAAIAFDMADGKAEAIIAAMQDLKMLDGLYVVNWEKRQGIKNGDKAGAGAQPKTTAERQREYRERQRVGKQQEERNAVTESNVTCNGSNALKEKNRKEKIKNIKYTALTPHRGEAGRDASKIPDSSSPPEEPDAPGMEFMQLREAWDLEMRSEGPLAGYKAYLALKKARAWPGLAAIRGDIQKRKQAGVWNPGYEPGLEKYLGERVWLAGMPKPRAAPERAKTFAEIEEEQRQRRRQRAMEYDLRKEREKREAENA